MRSQHGSLCYPEQQYIYNNLACMIIIQDFENTRINIIAQEFFPVLQLQSIVKSVDQKSAHTLEMAGYRILPYNV